MFVVDTNILIYAVDRHCQEHIRRRELLERDGERTHFLGLQPGGSSTNFFALVPILEYLSVLFYSIKLGASLRYFWHLQAYECCRKESIMLRQPKRLFKKFRVSVAISYMTLILQYLCASTGLGESTLGIQTSIVFLSWRLLIL